MDILTTIIFFNGNDRLTRENEFLKKRNLVLEERLPIDATPRKAEIIWNLDGMTSSKHIHIEAEYNKEILGDGATKEMRVLRGKLKKAEKENAELSSKYEVIMNERKMYFYSNDRNCARRSAYIPSHQLS